MTPERIATHDGRLLAVELYPVESARARLVLVHGYAEHRERYREVIGELTARGIECHAFDLRGHGQSDGSRGHVTRFADYLDDLQRVLATLPPSRAPLFLLAHSLGALIALAYVRAHPNSIDAVIVSSPYLGPAFEITAVQRILARMASLVAPALRIKNGLRPEWVSCDAQAVAAYRDDPRIFSTTTPRWFTEVTAAQRELLAQADAITTPALFLVAGSDRIADSRLSHDFFHRLGSTDKKLYAYPDLYHEIFNELPAARAAVLRDLLEWLEPRLGG